MKRLLLAFVCLLLAQISQAQMLYLRNLASCTGDVIVVLYAENGTGCGPGTYQSSPIQMPVNVAQSFDFSKPGMVFPWSPGTGAPSPGFNFVKAEVYNPCTGPFPSISSCTGNPTDYYVINNPSCGAPSSTLFEYSINCLTPCPSCPSPCNICPGPLTIMTAQFVTPGPFGSTWAVLVN